MYHIKNDCLYWGSGPVTGKVNLDRLVVLNEYWARDDKRLLCQGSQVRNVDGNYFRLLNTMWGYDGRVIVDYFGICKCVEYPDRFRSLDAGWYEMKSPSRTEFGMATDGKNIYFRRYYSKTQILKGVDLESFRRLAHGYAADFKKVWFEGGPIKGADSATFQVLSPFFARDVKYVYLTSRRLEGFSPESSSVPSDSAPWILRDGDKEYNPFERDE